jgi:hypothetical protein
MADEINKKQEAKNKCHCPDSYRDTKTLKESILKDPNLSGMPRHWVLFRESPSQDS